MSEREATGLVSGLQYDQLHAWLKKQRKKESIRQQGDPLGYLAERFTWILTLLSLKYSSVIIWARAVISVQG